MLFITSISNLNYAKLSHKGHIPQYIIAHLASKDLGVCMGIAAGGENHCRPGES